MPKINVYLPGDLAAAVRSAGFPVSPVCQRALAETVRAVSRARAGADAIRDPALDAAGLAEIVAKTEQGMTLRLQQIIERAITGCDPGVMAGTGQLLTGLIDDGANLSLRILQALDIDLDELRAAVDRADAAEPEAAGGVAGAQGASMLSMTMPARNAFAGAIEASIGLGHNYVGTEHLLLGLLAEPDSVAGRALGAHGIQATDARRALTAAVAGYAHGKQASGSDQTADHQAAGPGTTGHGADDHDELKRRLEAVESRLAALGA